MAITVVCLVDDPVFCTSAFQRWSMTFPLPSLGSDEKTLTSVGVSISNPPPSTLFPVGHSTCTFADVPPDRNS